ncbi:MAG: hypothetical protein WAX85_00680, partial [Minisyncoccia bacterium]
YVIPVSLDGTGAEVPPVPPPAFCGGVVGGGTVGVPGKVVGGGGGGGVPGPPVAGGGGGGGGVLCAVKYRGMIKIKMVNKLKILLIFSFLLKVFIILS